MKSMHWSLILVSALLQAAAAVAEQAPSESSTEEALGHIVILKKGLEHKHLKAHLDWVEKIHKRSLEDGNDKDQAKGVEHTYDGSSYGFQGYAGVFPPDVVENIKLHQDVASVEKDRVLTVERPKREATGTVTSIKNSGNRNGKTSNGLLSRGQGYNTFLDKGMVPDAVLFTDGKKRHVPAAPVNQTAAMDFGQSTNMRFNFTPPSANFTNVNMVEYFAKPDPDAIMDDILAELENEQNATALNVIHTRSATDPQDCTGSLTAYYKLTESFDSYIKALDVSGAATVSGWGQSASVSGNYLNQAELSKQGLTYIAIIDIQRQVELFGGFEFNKAKYKQSTFARDFGDKWIHGFHTGGKMIARLSFNSRGSTSKGDLKAHAEASLKFWGVTGDISATVKKSMEEVSRHADVEISLFYQGDLGKLMGQSGAPEKVSAASAEGSFKQVKLWADQFIDNACRHSYEYRPLLNDYRNAAGFPDGQETLDYRTAHRVSYKILKELVRISEITQYLLHLESIDGELKDEVEFAEIDMVEQSKAWVDSVVENPKNALVTGKQLILKFRSDFYDKFESAIVHDFYISGLEVVYGQKPPGNRVIDVHHEAEDINHNFGGEYVWLIPLYTTRRDEACTSFTTIIGESKHGLKSLSQGAGGNSRYLQCEKVMSEPGIRRLALHRGSESVGDFIAETRNGFAGRTSNINEGRGGEDGTIYLLWAHDDKRHPDSKKAEYYSVQSE